MCTLPQANSAALRVASDEAERDGSALSVVKNAITNRLGDLSTAALVTARLDEAEKARQNRPARTANFVEKTEVCILMMQLGLTRKEAIKKYVAKLAADAASTAPAAPPAAAAAAAAGAPGEGQSDAATEAAAELEEEAAADDEDAQLAEHLIAADAVEIDVDRGMRLTDDGLGAIAGLVLTDEVNGLQGTSAAAAVGAAGGDSVFQGSLGSALAPSTRWLSG